MRERRKERIRVREKEGESMRERERETDRTCSYLFTSAAFLPLPSLWVASPTYQEKVGERERESRRKQERGGDGL